LKEADRSVEEVSSGRKPAAEMGACHIALVCRRSNRDEECGMMGQIVPAVVCSRATICESAFAIVRQGWMGSSDHSGLVSPQEVITRALHPNLVAESIPGGRPEVEDPF